MTIDSTKLCNQGTDHDPAPSVAMSANTVSVLGPFSVARFGPSVGMTYDDVTGVTVAIVRPPAQ